MSRADLRAPVGAANLDCLMTIRRELELTRRPTRPVTAQERETYERDGVVCLRGISHGDPLDGERFPLVWTERERNVE